MRGKKRKISLVTVGVIAFLDEPVTGRMKKMHSATEDTEITEGRSVECCGPAAKNRSLSEECCSVFVASVAKKDFDGGR